MLLLKLAKVLSFSPPFLLCLPYVEYLMPHLTLRFACPVLHVCDVQECP